MPVAKELIRQIISENNISSVTDVYALLRDSFKDVLQELLEAEMEASIGHEKNQKGDLEIDNRRTPLNPVYPFVFMRMPDAVNFHMLRKSSAISLYQAGISQFPAFAWYDMLQDHT